MIPYYIALFGVMGSGFSSFACSPSFSRCDNILPIIEAVLTLYSLKSIDVRAGSHAIGNILPVFSLRTSCLDLYE